MNMRFSMHQGHVDEPVSPPIEALAAEWLATERQLAKRGLAKDRERAEAAAEVYEMALRHASAEDLQLAWRAAERAREECIIGSAEWADARSVARLLLLEYQTLMDR
jgi:hypothetical protein